MRSRGGRCFRQRKRHLDTYSLLISIIVNSTDTRFLADLIQVFFKRALASTAGVKEGTLMPGDVTLVQPKCFSGNISK